jgi:heat-inducible transcriptional repressor
VDYLMRVQALTSAEQQRIEHELSAQLNDMDDVMRHTSQLLALVTHQAGLVSGPDESSAEVRRIDLMPMSGTRVAVLIADNLGRVRTMMAGLDEPLQADELAQLARFLNENLDGAPLDKLSATVASRMHSYLDEQRRLAERALSVLDMLPKNRQSQLFLEGAMQLFEQPEFRDVGKAREVFSMLDERDRLLDLLRAGVEGAGCSVLIGSESRDQGMQEISVVASPYCVGDKPVGMLGVLGPRRMPYPRLMAIVDYTAGMLGRFLTRLAQ